MHYGFYMGTVRQRGIQTEVDGGGDDVPGSEKNPGNLRRVWEFIGGFLPEASHGKFPWYQITADKGGQSGRGGTNHICGILPQGLENRGFPSAGMPSGGPQRREAAGTFRVLALLVKVRDVARGKYPLT